MKISVMIYDENGRDVYAYIYHTNGFLASEGNYRNQMKEGKWKFFSSTINGYMVTEEHYTENIRNGKSIKYFENGNIADITIYSFGIKEVNGYNITPTEFHFWKPTIPTESLTANLKHGSIMEIRNLWVCTKIILGKVSG